MKTDLSSYNNDWYKPGNPLKRFMWYFFNIVFFTSRWNPSGSLKKGILRMFGAKIGKGVVIKPNVNIKYPWLLEVGDHTWIGEGVWIDNLASVKIGAHACISQGALLLCGNHNYKKTTFDLIVGEIRLEDGVWIGAKAIVTPRVTCFEHAILTAGSVATQNLEAFGIYQGNPAGLIRKRIIQAG
jgi:putative colanic acid biosynthesis acetyltransferase WcaF